MSIPQRSPMTVAGEKALRKELENLQKVERPRIIAAIAEARAHGDLSENAEYSAASEQQGFTEGRIREIEAKLANSQVVDIANMHNTGKVIFAATVTIENIESAEQFTYQIVGEDEADIKQQKISVTSPIARALIGKSVDDETVVKTPDGEVEYAILGVEYI